MDRPCRLLREFVERGARRLAWPGCSYMEMVSPRSLEHAYLSSFSDAGTGLFVFPNPLLDSFCREGPHFFLETDSLTYASPKTTSATAYAMTQASYSSSDGSSSPGALQSSAAPLVELRASALAQLGEHLRGLPADNCSAVSETVSSMDLSEDLADAVVLSSPKSSEGAGSWIIIPEDNLASHGWDHCS